MATPTNCADGILVFVPVGKETAAKTSNAPATLQQRAKDAPFVIGLLDNHKHNSDAVLARLQQQLAAKIEGAQFVHAKKPEAGKGAPKAMLDDLAARCDAVVNGIGD
ncbi:MAG: hypothetical protein FJY56_16320 [Betaproteobacteria bacterium]|nr:hypothetical protein [Betaproteobacteria bacterium]